MKLTSQAVNEIMDRCLLRDDEPLELALQVRGIANSFSFHRRRLAENAGVIAILLAQLPYQFQAECGGWSLASACYDRQLSQWTGREQQVEELFCLGIGAGKAGWLASRDMWPALPGGIPYVTIY